LIKAVKIPEVEIVAYQIKEEPKDDLRRCCNPSK
jgi:hypothetical protein